MTYTILTLLLEFGLFSKQELDNKEVVPVLQHFLTKYFRYIFYNEL